MNNKNIEIELSRINEYLEKCLWMDFEICQMSFIRVEVAGRIDSSVNEYAISVIFEQPTFIQGPFYWNLDSSKKFIELASVKEFAEINKKYQIEEGSILFKIYMDDFAESGFYIAAKNIKSKIYIDNPFA